MRDVHPGKNEKSGVVRKQMAISGPGFRRPADEDIPAPDLISAGRPRKTGNRSILDQRNILEMFADGLGITEVVIMLDEAIKQFLQAGFPDLAEINRRQVLNRGIQWSPVDVYKGWKTTLGKGIVRGALAGWQSEQAFSFQDEKEPAADHVFETAVWLNPVPCLANSAG